MTRTKPDGRYVGRLDGRLIAWLVAAWLACAACGKTTPPPAEPISNQEAVVAAEVEDDVGGVSVDLLEPGAEPRQTLRFKLAVGQKAQLSMRMSMAMTMSIDGVPQPAVPLPAMSSRLEVTIASISGTKVDYDWVIVGFAAEETPGVEPAVLSAIDGVLGQLKGVSGSVKTDTRGRNLGSSMNEPANATPQLREMLESMREAMATVSAPFPKEAVGIGGSWRVTQQMTIKGITQNVEYIYRVTEMTSDTVKADLTVNTRGVPGPIEVPTLPTSATSTLESMTGQGKGTVHLQLGSLAPISSDIRTLTNSEMTLRVSGQVAKLLSRLEMAIETKEE